MKITKTYSLSEKSLEKDIDKFIRDAKKGAYQYDYKYGQEGLKLIKAYFRMIEEEFKNQNFQVARVCYKKLLLFLLQRYYEYVKNRLLKQAACLHAAQEASGSRSHKNPSAYSELKQGDCALGFLLFQR